MKPAVLAFLIMTASLTGAAGPASAFCVVGDPVSLDGQWSQRFQQGKLGPFDHVRVDWIAGSQFQLAAFGGFSDPNWEVLWEQPDRAVAYSPTPSTDLLFDVHFQDSPTSPVDFYLTAFAGNELLESARATWTGDKCVWVIIPGDFKPDPEDPGVAPEPLTVVLLGGGLAVSNLMARRRKPREG